MVKAIITILLAGVTGTAALNGCDRGVAIRQNPAPARAGAPTGQGGALAQETGGSFGERMARWFRREPSASDLERVRQAVSDILNAPERPAYVRPDDARSWNLVTRFYKNRSQQPAWISSRGRGEQMEGLFRALARSDHEAIDPALHDVAALRDLERRTRSARGDDRAGALADLDVRLTYEFISYHSLLHGGQIDPTDVNPAWPTSVSRVASDSLLDAALQERRVERALATDDFAAGYVRLRDALAAYRGIATDGEWPRVAADKLAPGDSTPQVAALRARLAASGDLDETSNGKSGASVRSTGDEEALLYDDAITEAVKRFQARHGLEPDGIAGSQTISQLNVPVAERVRQIELNMSRWRWLPNDLGDRYIEVNVPAFELRAHDAGQEISMKVVAGDEYHPTPVFSDKMTHVVFRPYWSIPIGIALEEKLPQIMKDRDFLERDQLELVSTSGGEKEVVDPSRVRWSELAEEQMAGYSLRQKPGPQNSLGLVKFMFPNQFNVYLHDTPADKLFSREDRALSHGCVRVEKPALLAELVLRGNEGWTRERIDAAIAGEETQTIDLVEPVPVHIVYWTAFVEEDGTIQFRDDVYGIDTAMDAVSTDAMRAASSADR
jgi:murein L,D-transpeptidase YcbB/YkuD